MYWQIVCDFDGTIALKDVTDCLLGRFAHPQWLEIEKDWQAGRIGSRECMALQIALLDCGLDEIAAFAGDIPVDPDFSAFVADCRRRELPLLIVSDGLDLAIKAILARHHLAEIPVYSNRLCGGASHPLRLEFPHGHDTCAAGSGTCKCAVARSVSRHRRQTLLIGDGASDFCLAGQADLVLAKDKLLDHCRNRGIPHLAYRNFAEVRQILADLRATETPAAVQA